MIIMIIIIIIIYYIPIIQAQFIAGMLHACQSLYFGCRFTRWMQYALIAYGATILALFLNFYFHAYIKATRKKVGLKLLVL